MSNNKPLRGLRCSSSSVRSLPLPGVRETTPQYARDDTPTLNTLNLEQPRVLLLCLCGLPGGGKSTLAGALAASPRLRACGIAVRVVSYDDDVVAGAAWRDAHAASRERVLASLAASADGPCVIVSDDNAWLRSMRRELWALARDARAAFVSLHVDVNADVAVERDAARAAPVGEDVVRRMAAAFEPPSSCARAHPWEARHARSIEGTAPLHTVTASVESVLLGTGTDLLTEAALPDSNAAPAWVSLWQGLVPPAPLGESSAAVEAARTSCAASIVHQVDLALRKAVGEVLSRPSGAADAPAAAPASAAFAQSARRAKAAALQLARTLAARGELQAAVGWPASADGEWAALEAPASAVVGRLHEWARARLQLALQEAR